MVDDNIFMLQDDFVDYNEVFKERTKKLALEIVRFYQEHCKTDELRIIGKQVLRSATSVAANYRAAIRARSGADKFAKLCIVVEESDETLFWIELLIDADPNHYLILQTLLKETTEIVKVMSAYRKKYKPENRY